MTNIFVAFDNFEPEFKLFAYSIFILIVNSLACYFVYMLKNGYVIVHEFIVKTEQKMDKSLP